MLMLCFCVFFGRIYALADYKVIDSADLFFSDEKKQIESLAGSIDADYKMNVLVLTTQEKNGKSASSKAEDAYAAAGYEYNDAHGGIALIIDMANREICLVTERKMIRFITDQREEKIYDVGYGYLSNSEFGDAMIAMLEEVIRFMEKGIPGNQYNYDPVTGEISRYLSLTLTDIGIALGCAILLPLLVVLGIASGYKRIAKYKYDLNSNSTMKITSESDRYVKSYKTSRRINTGSSGGSGGSGSGRSTTHRSSSGHTYGGGHGRKF